MEKLVSSKGQIVPIRKRKSVYESLDKTEKEDAMPPPKPRVKQVVKKFKFYPTTLEKSNMFYPFISGVAKTCFIDILSKKKFINEKGLNWVDDQGIKDLIFAHG